MRRVLACAKCRKHKIKCVHQGKPPCAHCVSRGTVKDCQLSYPEVKSRKRNADEAGTGDGDSGDMGGQSSDTTGSKLSPVAPMDAIFTPGIRPDLQPQLRLQSFNNNVHIAAIKSIYDMVPMIPLEVVREGVLRVVSVFPELNFFYLPTALNNTNKIHPILVGALLAHAALFNPFTDTAHHSSRDHWLGSRSFIVTNCIYEKLTLEAIFNNFTFLIRPDLDIVRAMLLMSVVKWGHNEYYASWMLHGNAVRMLQSLDFDASFISKARQHKLLTTMKARTYWCAFALDRIISTGKGKCYVIEDYKNIPLPRNDEEFCLLTMSGLDAPVYRDKDGMNSETSLTDNNFIEKYYENPQLIKERPFAAFIVMYLIWGDINRRIMKPSCGGGPLECPWDSNSKTFQILKKLDDFWTIFPSDWKWSRQWFINDNPLLRKDNLLLTINSMYHLSLLFLHREYLPSFPYDVDTFASPPESCEFPPAPTPDYWEQSARKCFEATRNLSSLLGAMLEDEINKPSGSESRNPILSTPFYSFVAFACGTASCYGMNFYWMDPDHDKYDSSNDPRALSRCYSTVVQVLQAREGMCSVTRSWLAVVLKMQEINSYASKNRERFKQMGWDREGSQNLKETLHQFNPDLKEIEKSLPLLPRPIQNHKTSARSIDGSFVRAQGDMHPSHDLQDHQQNPNLFALPHAFSPSSFMSSLPSAPTPPMGSTTSNVYQSQRYPPPPFFSSASPGVLSHHFQATQSAVDASSRVATTAASPSAQHPLIPEVSHPSIDQSSKVQDEGFYQQQQGYGDQVPRNGMPSTITPFSGTLSYPPVIPHTVQNEFPVGLDTDKLTLLFNDQELDMLLQFKGQ
ncbi:LAMI_0F05974g1_1 [Lachancea mirantina]|uniref:LAMI_0F05974g1_1 n=1 Tax=Lachancea mirantina TaxID=1230905 RepID=A0A1G4JYV3_9SACH|nr:LAMI_0F05974g1_1 [Lachancea mirantina]